MSFARNVLALAAFEARLTLRLVRVWVLGILTMLLLLLGVGYYFAIHRIGAGFSGSFAAMTRDFAVWQGGNALGGLLALCGVFFVFDWRHRDTSTHFAPVLDASRLTPLEHVWGKFLGLAFVFVVPFALLTVLEVAAYAIARVPLGPAELLMGNLAWGLVPALGLTSVAFSLAGLTGNRAVSIVGGLAWIGLVFAGAFKLPERFTVLLGGTQEIPFHSLFVGYVWGWAEALPRLALLLGIGLFVTLAAWGKLGIPANAAARRQRASVTALVAALYVGTQLGAYAAHELRARKREAIVAAETDLAREPVARVTQRTIEVTLEPSRGRLSGTATLALANETPQDLTSLVFRLNSGLELETLEDDLGRAVPFERRHTLVVARPAAPLAAGGTLTLAFRYAGRIEREAVDAAAELAIEREKSAQQRALQRWFGTLPVVLERGAVVLPLDAGWYPEPGTLFGHRHPAGPPVSFAPGELAVTAPGGWKVAACGRSSVDADGTQRFAIDTPVPGITLCAARYEEATADVAGVRVRLLFHRKHRRTVEWLAEGVPELRRRAEERVADVGERCKLRYPLPELSLVEVPQQFAPWGAGWDPPNRMGAPGLVMLREGGLLGCHYDLALFVEKEKWSDPQRDAQQGGVKVTVKVDGAELAKPDRKLTAFDPGRAKADIIARFLRSDWTGGDVERLILKNAWEFRLQPEGEASPILGHALSGFIAEKALGRQVFDHPSAGSLFANNQAIGEVIQATINDKDTTDLLVASVANLDDVFELVESKPLRDLDPEQLGRDFLGVMAIKGRRPLMALADTLGEGRFFDGLAVLAERRGGGTFGWQDFRAALLEQADEAVRPQLEVLFDNWLESAELPAFVIRAARLVRLAGEPERWQATLVVANQGRVAGTFKLEAGAPEDRRTRVVALGPGAEIEVGLVLPRPADGYTLVPYVARNRSNVTGTFVRAEEPVVGAEAFEGTRPAPALAGPQPVVIDNLDLGFTVTLEEGEHVAYAAKEKDGTSPRLPAFRPQMFLPSRWSRWREPSGGSLKLYGAFDRTAALKKAGKEGGRPARWRAELPAPGTYRVEVFLPARPANRWQSGPVAGQLAPSVEYVVRTDAGEEHVTIDLPASGGGWTDVGRFRFGREAEVELLDKGKGLLIADAVRFLPEAS